VTTVALDEAFDLFPDGLSVLTAVRDDEGTIVDFLAIYANAALARVSGMRIDEIVDHRLLDFVPAFRDAGPFEAYREVVETGAPWQMEIEFDGLVGGARVSGVFEMRAVKLGDGILVTYRDMTDLRRAEAAAELMAAIVESTDDAIVGADGVGRITHWNPGAVRLLGYEREEIVGQYVRTLVRDEDFESQNARFSRVLSGELVERIETQWVRKDGVLLDVVLTASPLRDRSGEVVGASAVVHDITARKRDEAELRARTQSSSASPTSPRTTCASRSWPSPSSPRCSSAASTPSARRSSPTCAPRRSTAPGSSTACSISRASAAARHPPSRSTCAASWRACSTPSPRRSRRPAPASRSARCPPCSASRASWRACSRTCWPTR
jgi:PAS domain S-box-containing protein